MGRGGAIHDPLGPAIQDLAARNLMLRTESQPGREMLLRRPDGRIETDFRDDSLDVQDIQSRETEETKGTPISKFVFSFLPLFDLLRSCIHVTIYSI